MFGTVLPLVSLLLLLALHNGHIPRLKEVVSPREILLICVALAATRLPDLLKTQAKGSLRLYRLLAVFVIVVIVETGSIGSAELAVLPVTSSGNSIVAYSLISVTTVVIAFVWGLEAANEGHESHQGEGNELHQGPALTVAGGKGHDVTEEMSIRVAAEDGVHQADGRLAEATAAHTIEIDRIRREAQQSIAAAESKRDNAVRAAEAARDAALTEAGQRIQEAQQAGQRAAVAEARAEAATTEIARVKQDAARELEQLRTAASAELSRLRSDTDRERDELRELLQDRGRNLTEARDAQRRRAELAEHDLDAAHAELARLRPKNGTGDTPAAPC
jgi:hypothetical protein